MQTVKALLIDLVGLAGVAAAVNGFYLAWPPLGWLAAGGLLLAVAARAALAAK